MATKSSIALWELIGGSCGISIPDRITITCPKCGKEEGKDCHLMFYKGIAGTLSLGMICSDCGVVREPPGFEE